MSHKWKLGFGLLAGVGFVACMDGSNVDDGDAQALATQSRVWIGFAGQGKASVKSAVQAAHGQIHYEFDKLGAIVATVPSAAVAGLASNPSVTLIEDDVVRMPYAAAPGESPPYGVGMVEGLAMQAAGFDGSGVDVCIIDSGLRVQGGVPTSSPVTYIDGNLPANQDGFGHGTHVAGTIAGEPYTIGVAPGAHLIIVRVFGDDGAWAYSSTLADAANKCVAAGADVISMSLGGGSRSHFEQVAFDSAAAAGVLSIAAAGNDGNTRTSYPAGYGSVVSVGAIDSTKALASFSQRNRDVELAAPGVHVWSSLPYLDIANVTAGGATYDAALFEGAPATTGTSGTLVDGGLCDSVGAWSGKVVLCARGTITFADKVANAQSGGAVAAIVSNNVSGGFSGTLNGTSAIPAVAISLEDGDALRASRLGSSVTVTATHDTSVNGYDAWDGTSMATPHVSGAAALVKSACPGASMAQVRSALTASAQDLGAAGRDTSFGYGLVRACHAAQALCAAPVSCP